MSGCVLNSPLFFPVLEQKDLKNRVAQVQLVRAGESSTGRDVGVMGCLVSAGQAAQEVYRFWRW